VLKSTLKYAVFYAAIEKVQTHIATLSRSLVFFFFTHGMISFLGISLCISGVHSASCDEANYYSIIP